VTDNKETVGKEEGQQETANEEVVTVVNGDTETDQQVSVEQDGVAENGNEIDEKDQKISELESKLVDEENKLLRVLADFENAKRRNTLDMEVPLQLKLKWMKLNLS
jgi:molecular chaperone GrpE